MKILAIDPSINFMGIAIYSQTQPFKWDLISPKTKSDDFVEKSKDSFNQIKYIVNKYKIQKIIIELYEFWGPSGYLARESGAVIKMTFLTGMICSLPNTEVVPVSKWKGQLPKEVVRNRLIKLYPKLDIKNMNHNVVDAIGIGHWFIYRKI